MGYDVNRLQRKIAASSFLPQGSLLTMIKEDGSERSLFMDLRLGGRQWMKATSKAIVGIAWKMEVAEMAIG
ncbi:hypothetical protein BHE74_00021727 [Ensete ventricosum]|nr:hypothetical protein BHE74_00021727 [Ensete ventricosum]